MMWIAFSYMSTLIIYPFELQNSNRREHTTWRTMRWPWEDGKTFVLKYPVICSQHMLTKNHTRELSSTSLWARTRIVRRMRLVFTDSFERLALALELHQPDFLFTLMTPYEGKLWLLDWVPGLICIASEQWFAIISSTCLCADEEHFSAHCSSWGALRARRVIAQAQSEY